MTDATKQPAEGPVERRVRPPAECSPDWREVWDWAARFSDRTAALDELRRLRQQAHNARTTCGSCTQWMTDACPREQHDNRAGRKQGPSSMAIKCERFSMSAADAKSLEACEAKIAGVLQRLQAA